MLSKMLRIAVLFALALSTLGSTLFDPQYDDLWEKYKSSHDKVYASEEEGVRRLIWEKAVRKIVKHNLEADLGLHTYTLGINQFADMTNEEFRAQMNGYKKGAHDDGSTFLPPSHVTLPDEVDWRKEGLVTPVKTQGNCGSCWAFSATGSVEGQHKKKTGKLVSLSEQNLVDCSGPEGNSGCLEGTMFQAFDYIIKNGGIDTEVSYPYQAQNGTCRFNNRTIGATITGYKWVKSRDEIALKAAVATVGPISVGIDASSESFRFYKSGVYVDKKCVSDILDHAILAVGYGTEKGQDYWLIKNSWGIKWGDAGYIKMARNHNNMCGIATDAIYPLV